MSRVLCPLRDPGDRPTGHPAATEAVTGEQEAGNLADVVQAAGGVRTCQRPLAVRALGVTRDGATATKAILDGARARL